MSYIEKFHEQLLYSYPKYHYILWLRQSIIFIPEIKQTKRPIEFTGCQHKSSPPTVRSNRSRQPGPVARCVTTRCQTQFYPNSSFPPLLFFPRMLLAARVNLILTFGSVQAKQTNCRENELNAKGRKKAPRTWFVVPKQSSSRYRFFFLCSVILAPKSERDSKLWEEWFNGLGLGKPEINQERVTITTRRLAVCWFFFANPPFFLVRCQVYCSRATPLLLGGKTSHPLPITNRPIVVGASGKFNDGFLFFFFHPPLSCSILACFQNMWRCGRGEGNKIHKILFFDNEGYFWL